MTADEMRARVDRYTRARDRLFVLQISAMCVAGVAALASYYPLFAGGLVVAFLCSAVNGYLHNRIMETFRERSDSRDEEEIRDWAEFRKAMNLPAVSSFRMGRSKVGQA